MAAYGSVVVRNVTDALVEGFDDPKPSVRFMAAASYIRLVSPLKSNETPHRRVTAKKKSEAKPS